VATRRLQERMTELVDEVQRSYPDGTPPGAWWVPARLGGGAPSHDEVLRAHEDRFRRRGGSPLLTVGRHDRETPSATSPPPPVPTVPPERAVPRPIDPENPAASWLYRLAAWVAFTVMRLQRWRCEVSGLEHVPTTGGAVLAANHTSFWDFFTVGRAPYLGWGRPVRILAKESLFRTPVFGWLMRKAEHIPVHRGTGTQALHSAVEALEDGELVLVLPSRPSRPPSTCCRSRPARPGWRRPPACRWSRRCRGVRTGSTRPDGSRGGPGGCPSTSPTARRSTRPRGRPDRGHRRAAATGRGPARGGGHQLPGRRAGRASGGCPPDTVAAHPPSPRPRTSSPAARARPRGTRPGSRGTPRADPAVSRPRRSRWPRRGRRCRAPARRGGSPPSGRSRSRRRGPRARPPRRRR
jgi:1-acyl-sn-glycerol-3-phosphate acyltransferase